MKKILTSGFFLILFVVATQLSMAQKAKTETTTIKTEFHCNEGKALIEKEVGKLPGVTQVVADLTTHVVTVVFDPDKMSRARINSIIEKAGFKTELTKESTKITPACEKKPDSQCGKK